MSPHETGTGAATGHSQRAGRLRQEIEERLRGLLERLAAGEDTPPGPRLRLEGLLEAAVLLGVYEVSEIDALIDGLHRELRGQTLGEALGDDWREHHPFPECPLFMDRAPVSPSTSA